LIAQLALTGAIGFLIISASITFLILFFGEIIPKVFATKFALKMALRMAPLMWGLSYLLWPVVVFLERVVKSINKLFRHEATGVTKDDVEIFVEEGEKQGLFTDIESMIVRNLMDFRETSVDAVFRHRTEIFALNQSLTLREAIEETLARPHSRIPIYAGDKDNIVGLLTLRDLLTISYDESNMERSLSVFPIKEIAKVPVTASIFDMFIQMKKHGRHLAIVVDEYGGTA
jgi:CBS domain containing-hemolysin-like protein